MRKTEEISDLLLKAEELAYAVSLNPLARRRLNRTEKVWAYRPYQGGEEMTRIDWRQSARGDKILVREAEEIHALPVYLWAASPPSLLLAVALGFMLIKAGRAVGWIEKEANPTKTAALWRETRPPEALPPETLPFRKGTLVLFPDDSESWPLRLKEYMRQGVEGLIITDAPTPPSVEKTAQTIGWPLLKNGPKNPPEKILLAAFEETLNLSV